MHGWSLVQMWAAISHSTGLVNISQIRRAGSKTGVLWYDEAQFFEIFPVNGSFDKRQTLQIRDILLNKVKQDLF